MGKKALLYGPRFSIGVVGMGWMQEPPSWWDAVAREITLWEQAGCLSPRILFVAGSRPRFAQRLGEAMGRRQELWPVPPRSPGEASAVHAFRAPYDLADPKQSGWVGPVDTAWTVAWDEDPSAHIADTLARLLYVTGEAGEAIALQRRAVQTAPDDEVESYREVLRQMEAGEELGDRPPFEYYPGVPAAPVTTSQGTII